MSTCAVVPVRDLRLGKTRLASALDPAGRETLLRTMLGRVLDALRGSGTIDEIVVVTSDPGLGVDGATVLRDEGVGLNAAVAHGLRYAAGGHGRAVVVAADVPHVTAAEIERLLRALDASAVVVVPDARREGTNALGLRLPPAIEPRFGEDSCRRHVQAAVAAGIEPTVLPLAGLGRDVDVPEDLDRYVPPSRAEALALAAHADLASLMRRAGALAVQGHGRRVSYSRKVFTRYNWSVQVNLKNIGVGDELIPIWAQPDGSIASWRIAEPQKWTLTSTLSF